MKNEYEAEYRQVQTKAKTAEYAATRRDHPKIERKLGEAARHHGNRHARYRGLTNVRKQSFLTAMVVNVKRMLKLLSQKMPVEVGAQPVRAELAVT